MRKQIGFLLLAATAFGAGPARALDLITVEFSGAMTDLQRQTFLDAASFWNSTITGYKGADYDGVGVPAAHRLAITASLPEIDGAGGVLGQAGPTNAEYFDNNPLGTPSLARYYSTTGIMEFDLADVAVLMANNSFFGVVLHEMGHVLGLGTLWSFNSINDPGFNMLYDPAGETGLVNGEPVGRYLGQHALAGWINEFNQPGATFVPVEKGGDAGTVDGHWNESDGGFFSLGPVSNRTGLDISQELMTGWASDTFFLSEVTLGALEDLGYEVDYAKAGIIDHVVSVPEPGAIVPAAGLAAFALVRRRARRAKSGLN